MINPKPPHDNILPGFHHITHRWDPALNHYLVNIGPGEVYVTNQNYIISTIVGSCVAVCIRDINARVGGMNHFLLPSHEGKIKRNWQDDIRYGNWSMEFLINEILKNGGQRKNLEVKVFGGGDIIHNATSANIGEKNIKFAFKYIEQEKLYLANHDVGGNFSRKILYDPVTGVAKVRKIISVESRTVEAQEKAYIKSLAQHEPTGAIEIFNRKT